MTIRMILTERHACEVYPNPLISRWLASNVKRRIRTLILSISSFYYVFSIDLSGKVAVRSFAAHAAPAAAHAPVAHEVPAVHDPSLPPLPTGAPRGKIEDGKIMPLEGEVFSVQFAPEGFALVVEPTLYDSLEWVLSSPPPIHQFIEPPVSWCFIYKTAVHWWPDLLQTLISFYCRDALRLRCIFQKQFIYFLLFLTFFLQIVVEIEHLDNLVVPEDI